MLVHKYAYVRTTYMHACACENVRKPAWIVFFSFCLSVSFLLSFLPFIEEQLIPGIVFWAPNRASRARKILLPYFSACTEAPTTATRSHWKNARIALLPASDIIVLMLSAVTNWLMGQEKCWWICGKENMITGSGVVIVCNRDTCTFKTDEIFDHVYFWKRTRGVWYLLTTEQRRGVCISGVSPYLPRIFKELREERKRWNPVIIEIRNKPNVNKVWMTCKTHSNFSIEDW